MPVITVQCGKLEKEQKREIIESFTKKASEIMEVPKEAFSVIISEHEDENLGHGGEVVEDIKARRNKGE